MGVVADLILLTQQILRCQGVSSSQAKWVLSLPSSEDSQPILVTLLEAPVESRIRTKPFLYVDKTMIFNSLHDSLSLVTPCWCVPVLDVQELKKQRDKLQQYQKKVLKHSS